MRFVNRDSASPPSNQHLVPGNPAFAHMGLGLGHLTHSNSSNNHADYITEASRRRTSSNFIEGILSDPVRLHEVFHHSVKEDFEHDDTENIGKQSSQTKRSNIPISG